MTTTIENMFKNAVEMLNKSMNPATNDFCIKIHLENLELKGLQL